MPYALRKKGARYEVINTDTGEVKSRHTSKAKAEKQMKLLKGIEHDWTPTGEPDTFTRKMNGRHVKLHLTGGKGGTNRRGKGHSQAAE